MDVSTGAWKRITSGSGNPTSPVYSPDGEVLAYASDRRGDFEVNLTNDEQDNFSPSFSSDGEKIVHTEDATTNIDLMVMGADGGNRQRITDSPAVERQPNWRPEPPAEVPSGEGPQAGVGRGSPGNGS